MDEEIFWDIIETEFGYDSELNFYPQPDLLPYTVINPIPGIMIIIQGERQDGETTL